MPKLADAVPSYIEAVTIWAHPDPAGQKGARELAARLRARGNLLQSELQDRSPDHSRIVKFLTLVEDKR